MRTFFFDFLNPKHSNYTTFYPIKSIFSKENRRRKNQKTRSSISGEAGFFLE